MEMENKITALTGELTLDEKIGLIHGCALFHTAAAEEKGLPPLVMSDGPMGVRADFFEIPTYKMQLTYRLSRGIT